MATVLVLIQQSIVLFRAVEGSGKICDKRLRIYAGPDHPVDDMTVGGKDQIGGICAHAVFDGDIVAVGVPGLDAVGVFGGSIQLNFYADEFILKIIAGLLLWKDRRGHKAAGAAPGGEAVHKDIFVFSFGFCLDSCPAEIVFEVNALVVLYLWLGLILCGCQEGEKQE